MSDNSVEKQEINKAYIDSLRESVVIPPSLIEEIDQKILENFTKDQIRIKGNNNFALSEQICNYYKRRGFKCLLDTVRDEVIIYLLRD